MGAGVRTNKSHAARWFRAAADQEFAPAVHNLATAYAFGTGVPKDAEKASSLFRRAAALGDANAAFSLGQRSALDRDPATASEYLGLASRRGHPRAKDSLT